MNHLGHQKTQEKYKKTTGAAKFEKKTRSPLSPAVAMVKLTILVVTDLKGHPRSTIFMSSERAYATSVKLTA